MFKVNGITLPSMLKMFFGYALSCNSEELNVRNIVRIDNNQNLVDRLSSLPDKLIRHILSLVDTKYAVRTQILSKRWIGQWRHIHSLNLDHSSFSCRAGFKAFVHRVLVHREGKDLVKIKAFCGDTVGSKQTLMCPLFTHAQDYKVTEIETDAIAYFPPMYEDNNNNSTDDFDHSDHCFNLQHMNTLRISATSFYSELDLLSADCFIPLKNLHIVDCSVHSKILDLSVTFMDNVTISNLRFCKKVYVMAGSIKVFNWEGESPCWFHFYNSYPQKMNIYISSSPDACGTTEWFAEIGNMIESCNLSSVKVVLKTFKVYVISFPIHFILYSEVLMIFNFSITFTAGIFKFFLLFFSKFGRGYLYFIIGVVAMIRVRPK